MADIRHLLDKIRKAIYGKEVRGSLADGLEAVNNEVEDTTEVAVNVEHRQDAVEQQFDDVLAGWSDDRPVDNAETIASRTNRETGENFDNLGQRLDRENKRVTEQLAGVEKESSFIKLKANEMSYHELLVNNSTDVGGHSLSVLADRNLEANVKLTEHQEIRLEFKKNDNDDFIKFRKATLKPTILEIKSANYSNVIVGTMTSTSGNNHYTTQVGTKIQFDFTGTSISFFHWTDERGGVWKCYVDGLEVGSISTHINAVKDSEKIAENLAERLIVDNLENEQHTLVMEFVGQDNINPVSEPRGWIRYNDGSAGNPDYNLDTFKWIELDRKHIEMFSDSNKEFAFNIDKDKEGANRQWLPEHNNIGTLFKGDQKLYIDGEEQSITEKGDYSFKEIKIYQKLYGQHSSFVDNVCEIIIVATINYLGVNFETKVKWLQEAFIFNGYVNMLTLHTDFASSLVSSYGKKYELKLSDGSLEYISEIIPYSFLAISDNHQDFYITVSSANPKRTYRFGEAETGGSADGSNFYYIQHRSESLQKLYPESIKGLQVKKGDEYRFDGHFGFGFLPGIKGLV